MMYAYYPEYSPDLEIYYNITDPGQIQTHNQPGIQPEIEIESVEINGKEADPWLTAFLIDAHEAQWKEEILNKMNDFAPPGTVAAITG